MRILSHSLLLALVSSLAFNTTFAAPIITAGPGLDQNTWNVVSKGTWLVEHYSPYCGHCRAFAPTWRDLVDSLSESSAKKGFHFAQVDCAAHGDLCQAHGVKYYPSLFLYVNGELYDEFDGKRSLDELTKYVKENMPGTVVWLDENGNPEEGKGVAPGDNKGNAGLDAASDKKKKTGTQEDQDKDKNPQLKVVEETDEPTALDILMSSSSGSTAALPPSPARPLHTPDQAGPPSQPQPPPVAAGLVAQPHAEEMKRDSGGGDAEKEASLASQDSDGTVRPIFGENDLSAIKSKGSGPAFIKFYAPWCGHCKSLAPKWKDLAAAVKGTVNIYEVDCEDGRNKRVCRQEGIGSYPTLVFFNEGTKVEYNGKRDLGSMKQFALKAASSTTVRAIANKYELMKQIAAEEVVFLFLHGSDTSKDDTAIAIEASKHLLGGPPFFTSSSPDLFSLFSLPTTEPRILVFKEHSQTPSSTFPLPPSTAPSRARKESTVEWFRTAKLLPVSELNSQTFGDIMSQKATPPLVGLAVLSPKALGLGGMQTAKTDLRKLADSWMETVRKDRLDGEREVIWAWVDGDRWGGWVKSLYGVKVGSEPVIVVADPKALTYWKTGINGAKIQITGDSVIQLIKGGIYTSLLKPLSSRNFVERVGSKMSNGGAAARDGAVEHPILFLFFLIAVAVGIWWFVKWLSAPSNGGIGERGNGYAKIE
ncbi:thioredoxin-like protein [Meredithblackwellia eburnea MCA 4105]